MIDEVEAKRVADLVKIFENSAKEFYRGLDLLNNKIQRKAVANFFDAAKELDTIGSGRRNALENLLDNDHSGVRVTAAFYLINLMPEKALAVLREIHAMRIGEPSIRAMRAIFMYEHNNEFP
jgi:hypothetical protein